MSGRIGLLGALLAVQLVLVAVLLLADASLGLDDESTFLAIDSANVDAMEILDAEGNSVKLQRSADGWALQLPAAAESAVRLPADQNKVVEVLDTLLGLRAPWPVGTTAETRERFEVTENAFQRKLTLRGADGTAIEIYLGTSPGYRRVHAGVAGSDEVFSIDFSNYQLPAAAGDWLDSTLLTAEGEISSIERRDGWVLQRNEEGWLIDGAAADQEAASQLVGRFQGLGVTGLAEMSDAGEVVGLGSAAEFVIRDVEGSYRLALYGSTEGDEYRITSDRQPGGFTLAAYIAEQLVVDSEDLSATTEDENAESSPE